MKNKTGTTVRVSTENTKKFIRDLKKKRNAEEKRNKLLKKVYSTSKLNLNFDEEETKKNDHSETPAKCISILASFSKDSKKGAKTKKQLSKEENERSFKDNLKRSQKRAESKSEPTNLADVEIKESDLDQRAISIISQADPAAAKKTIVQQNRKKRHDRNFQIAETKSKRQRAEVPDLAKKCKPITKKHTRPKIMRIETTQFDDYRMMNGPVDDSDNNHRNACIERWRQTSFHKLNQVCSDPKKRNCLPEPNEIDRKRAELVTKVMEMMPKFTSMINYNNTHGLMLPELQECTKEYNYCYLRKADPQFYERNCRNGQTCESYVEAGFICREFLLPDTDALVKEALSKGEDPRCHLPKQVNFCLKCERQITTILHDMHHSTLQGQALHIYQTHRVPIDIVGQYRKEICLMSDNKFNGIIAPFPRYIRNYYKRATVKDHGDKLYDGWIEVADVFFRGAEVTEAIQD